MTPSSASPSHLPFPAKLPRQPAHDLLLPLPAHRPAQQPICHAHDAARFIPAPALLGVLDRVREDAAVLVELEDEQAVELLVGVAHAEPFGDFVNGFVGAVVVQGPAILVRAVGGGGGGGGLEFPACFPAHDEALVVHALGGG